jgi:GNAT superfamily N-acetyltransferase
MGREILPDERWARLVILTHALADRLERALTTASLSRLAEVQRLGGNPLGIESRRFGRVTAHLIRREVAYYEFFNGPLDLRAGDEDAVPEMVAWYRDNSRPCYIRLSPFFAGEPLLGRLAASGLQHSGFMSVLYGVPDPSRPPPAPGVTVRMFRAPNLDLFVRLSTAGAPRAERGLRQALARAEFARWRCYVGLVDGRPAAHAGLYLDQGSGTSVLAAAETLPGFRGRGCQTALLHQRLADAAASGCDLAVSEASPGSTSQRNLERVGLRAVYTKVTWTAPAS